MDKQELLKKLNQIIYPIQIDSSKFPFIDEKGNSWEWQIKTAQIKECHNHYMKEFKRILGITEEESRGN